jgi:hypothetical protein
MQQITTCPDCHERGTIIEVPSFPRTALAWLHLFRTIARMIE